LRDASEEIRDECLARGAVEEVCAYAGVGFDLFIGVGIELDEIGSCIRMSVDLQGVSQQYTYKILHGQLASLVDVFHKLQDVVSEAVYDRHTNIVVVLILMRQK
jgi:hypothetical protein